MEEKDLTPIPQSEVDEWFQDPAMNKWIEGLEENFKFGNHHRGDLIEYDGQEIILEYRVPQKAMFVKGMFTPDQLEALAGHIRKNS